MPPSRCVASAACTRLIVQSRRTTPPRIVTAQASRRTTTTAAAAAVTATTSACRRTSRGNDHVGWGVRPPMGLRLGPRIHARHLHLEGLARGLALAPLYFGGLFVALWTWKCCMLVVFQSKIIFMPGMPPNARRERIADYAGRCGAVQWREERTRAADGTDLALAVADVDVGRELGSAGHRAPDVHFHVLYFQGNASSTPPRLPDLSSTLSMLKRRMHEDPRCARITFVCLSYRGYWKSRGRANEKGIRLDAAAALQWISQYHQQQQQTTTITSSKPPPPPPPPPLHPGEVVLWGQSIGAGVATNLAAEHAMPDNLRLDSLLLETPFTSVRAMLEVLYPQRWLPYKHLWPFLRNHLDSAANLGAIARRYAVTAAAAASGSSQEEEKQEQEQEQGEMAPSPPPPPPPRVFILEAAKDELVSAALSRELHDIAVRVGLPVETKAVAGAFHNDTMFRPDGRRYAAAFLAERIEAKASLQSR